MTPEAFFARALIAAISGGHVWPDYAACEVAEESNWGESELAVRANNLFGLKQGQCTRSFPTIELPTTEIIHGQPVPASALWPVFGDWAEAFSVRMEVLRTLAGDIPDYAAALAATDGTHFVIAVSRSWSTDPRRAANVLAIHAANAFLLAELLADSSQGAASL